MSDDPTGKAPSEPPSCRQQGWLVVVCLGFLSSAAGCREGSFSPHLDPPVSCQPVEPSAARPFASDPDTELLFHMDEGQGYQLADASGHERHGSLFQARWSDQGRFGCGLQLDGQDDHVRLSPIEGAAIDEAGQVTVEGWVFPQDLAAAAQVLFDHGGAAQLSLETTDGWIWAQFELALDDGMVSLRSQDALTPRRWHHLAADFDGEQLRIWLNGRLSAELSHAGELSLSQPPTPRSVLGASATLDGGFFGGMLDELRLSRTARYDGTPAAVGWAVTFPSPAFSTVGDVVAWPDGSSIVGGSYDVSVAFDTGDAEPIELTTDRRETFVARIDAFGHAEWAAAAGGAAVSSTPTKAVVGLPDGSVLVTGAVTPVLGGTNEVTFGRGQPSEHRISITGAASAYVAKYLVDGTFDWVAHNTGGTANQGEALAACPDGSFHWSGAFDGDTTFGAGEPNETTLTSHGGRDVFIGHFSATGQLAWATAIGGANTDKFSSVASLPDGGAMVFGSFMADLSVGSVGADNQALSFAGYYRDCFIARHGPAGDLQWAKSLSGHCMPQAVAVVPGTADVIVVGYFEGTLEIDDVTSHTTALNQADAFAIGLDPFGTRQWSFTFGAEQNDHALDIAVADDGSFTVTGRFSSGELVLGQGEPNETTLTNVNPGEYEGFIARFDPDRTLRWARGISGSGHQQATALAPGGSSFLLAGVLAGETLLWDGQPEATTLSSTGDSVGFLMLVGP